MKSMIKYFLNVLGLMFILIGLTCNISNTWATVFYVIGFFMYILERQISVEDEEEQKKHIKKLEEKVEELENKSRKEYVKPKLSVEAVPYNYEEYLKSKDRW